MDALNRHDISVDKDLIQIWHRVTGFQNSPASILQFEDAPTAFFTQHLAVTTDLLKALEFAHISIPGDVSVIGFDDIPMAEFFKVPITVIKQQPYVVGTEAARLLINQLQSPDRKTSRIMVPCSLIERDSCGRPGA